MAKKDQKNMQPLQPSSTTIVEVKGPVIIKSDQPHIKIVRKD